MNVCMCIRMNSNIATDPTILKYQQLRNDSIKERDRNMVYDATIQHRERSNKVECIATSTCT